MEALKINQSISQPALVEGIREGQLWRLKSRYVYIVALTGSSIQFKLMDAPNGMSERTLSSGIDTLLRYLLTRKGRLVNNLADTARLGGARARRPIGF